MRQAKQTYVEYSDYFNKPTFIHVVPYENRILDTDTALGYSWGAVSPEFKHRQKLLIKVIKSWGEAKERAKKEYEKLLLEV